MRIDGSIPMHVARAYGLPAANQARPVHKLSLSSQVSPTGANPPMNASQIGKLIAGTVNRPIDFNTTATPSIAPMDALQLYTRAADRVEAATAVQTGRQIDVKG